MIGTAVLLTGCIVQPARIYSPPPQYYPAGQQQYQQAPQSYESEPYQEPVSQPVVSVYVEPPLMQPEPVLVAWAPPPMLVESPPPVPYGGAIWTGGYWAWEGNWVWAHGRWSAPPQPGYGWVNPYYENRGGAVVFINGYWSAPGQRFIPPPAGISITIGIVAAGVYAGPRCNGPQGVFVPPPPGSHSGLIVPAPIGTAPAVVTGAPPIIHQGMRITTVNNSNNVTNVTNNVTIVAPASATVSGRAYDGSVPAQPHLAAAMTPVVHAYAPTPLSNRAIPAYVAGRPPAVLPGSQSVHVEMPPGLRQSQPGAQPGQMPQPARAMIQPASSPVSQDNRYQQNEPKPLPQDQRQQLEQRQKAEQRQQTEQRQQQDLQQQRQQLEQRQQSEQRQQVQQKQQTEQRQQQDLQQQRQQSVQTVQPKPVQNKAEPKPQNNESKEAREKRTKEEADKKRPQERDR